MGRLVNLTGQKFGRLTVIERAGSTNAGKARWRCKCECGNETIVCSCDLMQNKTHSCGCWNRSLASKRNRKHGLSKSRIHRIWSLIKDRCFNSKNSAFKNYGERGITMCKEWKDDFLTFYHWSLQNGYSESLSIDRIDNNGNYEPNNCRWADRFTQANNTRNNCFITIEGKSLTITQAARKYNIPTTTLWCRVKRGVSGTNLIEKRRLSKCQNKSV